MQGRLLGQKPVLADDAERAAKAARAPGIGKEAVFLDQERAFRLDQLAKVLRFEGQSVELTERETTILAVLLGSPGQVFDPQEIALTAWNGESPGDIDLARRHVSNLRSKLEAIPEAPRIATQRGIGYRVDVDI